MLSQYSRSVCAAATSLRSIKTQPSIIRFVTARCAFSRVLLDCDISAASELPIRKRLVCCHTRATDIHMVRIYSASVLGGKGRPPRTGDWPLQQHLKKIHWEGSSITPCHSPVINIVKNANWLYFKRSVSLLYTSYSYCTSECLLHVVPAGRKGMEREGKEGKRRKRTGGEVRSILRKNLQIQHCIWCIK